MAPFRLPVPLAQLLGSKSVSRRLLLGVGAICAAALFLGAESRRSAEAELAGLAADDARERGRLVQALAADEDARWRAGAEYVGRYDAKGRRLAGDRCFPLHLPLSPSGGSLFRSVDGAVVEISYRPAAGGAVAAARSWDRTAIRGLERRTNTRVEWISAAEFSRAKAPEEDRFESFERLDRAPGEPRLYRRYSANAPVIAAYRIALLRQQALLTAMIGLILIGVGAMLGRLVASPLRRLARAVESGDLSPIAPLLEDGSEIGQQARLIESWLLLRSELVNTNEWLEREVGAQTRELEEAYTATISSLVSALEYRDQETAGHCARVTETAELIARRLGLGEEQIVELRRGALLHDIGKIAIPDGILLKPGRLSEAERRMMEGHAEIGWEMLKDIRFLQGAMDVTLSHHERWDGAGYPHGIAGEDIPLYARIFAVADVWDALSSDRPYRRAWPRERVRAHILAASASHFDPSVVAAFELIPIEALPCAKAEVETADEIRAAA